MAQNPVWQGLFRVKGGVAERLSFPEADRNSKFFSAATLGGAAGLMARPPPSL